MNLWLIHIKFSRSFVIHTTKTQGFYSLWQRELHPRQKGEKMRTFFAVQQDKTFNSGWLQCLNWARQQIKENDTAC